jgi:periplasmic divalent cation tolerance protein
MKRSTFTVFYITHESLADAKNFVQECLNQKWIACGNIFPVDSAYEWKGDTVGEGEYVSIVKTGNHLVSDFINIAEKIHPYEVPCLTHWETQANPSYLNWIYECVRDE